MARQGGPTSGLVDQGGLLLAGHLGGEVDVAGQVRLAGDRVGVASDRVLEGTRRVDLVRRRLATRRQGDGPLDRQAGVVVLGGDGEQVEVRVVGLVVLVEAGQQVAVGGGNRRN